MESIARVKAEKNSGKQTSNASNEQNGYLTHHYANRKSRRWTFRTAADCDQPVSPVTERLT